MKNFLIGFMIAAWSWPTIKEVAVRVAKKLEEETRP